MGANKFTILNDSYDDTIIRSGAMSLVESLTGDELKYDTFEITIDTEAKTAFFLTSEYEIFQTANKEDVIVYANVKNPNIESYVYGTPVFYYHNDVLLGKFYVENVSRTGKYTYLISCISGIGLLKNSQHYGGIYNGTTFAELADEIIGGIIPYTLDPLIANQPIYGWLPIGSRRENLHQLLFAMSASIRKDQNGDVYVTILDADTATEIDKSRIYQGGQVEYPQVATKITLAEHAYIERNDDETITLFDGAITAETITTPLGKVVSGGVIVFDEPSHTLVAQNTTILESGVNYAVLAPSSECVLTGQKFTHTVRQITRPETDRNISLAENKIVVDNATLISVVNSENVVNRLQGFYSSAKKVNIDFILENELAGNLVTFTDPFDEEEQGFISSMNVNLSKILKANTEIIANYLPTSGGNYYNNVQVITDDTTWIVPKGVERVRVVLIGGGQGGWSGGKGENGSGDGWQPVSGLPGGAGGAPGNGGKGGKIYITTIEVTEGENFLISIGVGGEGGICTLSGAGEGKEGTASTFGTYTSDNGTVSSIGYTEILSGESYAIKGDVGLYSGAPGGSGSSNKTAHAGGSLTIDGITYKGGAGGSYRKTTNSAGTQTIYNYPGGGGGAAAGADGNSATYAAGADGANATIAGGITTLPGKGGIGGNGGGGGGGGGIRDAEGESSGATWTHQGNGGLGGLGSQGGIGASGCVIIYF